jgi:hypothetical protein
VYLVPKSWRACHRRQPYDHLDKVVERLVERLVGTWGDARWRFGDNTDDSGVLKPRSIGRGLIALTEQEREVSLEAI